MNKRIQLTILLLAVCNVANSQVIVKNTDLNNEVQIFELYAFKKPFSTKECYFINFGQEKFRLHFYDHKSQAVFDKKNNKFEKGEWLRLLKYIQDEGWEKTGERNEKLGSNEGRVVTFEKIARERQNQAVEDNAGQVPL